MNAAAAPSFQPRDPAADGRMDEAKLPEQRANEPSMEEILASIRKIISDDSALPRARKLAPVVVAVPPAPLPAGPVAEQVFVAPAPVVMAAPAPHEVQVHPAIPEPEVAAHPQSAEIPGPAAEMPHELAAPQPGEEEEEDEMDLAGQPLMESDYAFLSTPAPAPPLHIAVELAPPAMPALPQFAPLPQAAPQVLTSPGTDAAVSASFQSLAQTVMLNNTAMIESMTREMLRPMLKTWLDDNLPVMVERLVRAEIERVARGGR